MRREVWWGVSVFLLGALTYQTYQLERLKRLAGELAGPVHDAAALLQECARRLPDHDASKM